MSKKKDYIEVHNLPDFSDILGCFIEPEDGYTHLGQLFVRRTACGQPMGQTIMSRDVTVTCPVCIAEIRYRVKHPRAAKQEMGKVTHRGVKE